MAIATQYQSLQDLIALSTVADANKVMVLLGSGSGGEDLGAIDLTTFRAYVLGDTTARVEALEARPAGGTFTTAVTLTLTGAVTGSASFDGSENFSLATTIADGSLSMAAVNGLSPALTSLSQDIGDVSQGLGTLQNTLSIFEFQPAEVTLLGDLLPDIDNTRSLGSAQRMWKDVYIGPGSLYINGQKVLDNTEEGTIGITADTGQNISVRTFGSGDIELSPQGTGVIQLKGPVLFNAASKIRSSDGNPLLFDDNLQFSPGVGVVGGLSVDGYSVWHSGNFDPTGARELETLTLTGTALDTRLIFRINDVRRSMLSCQDGVGNWLTYQSDGSTAIGSMSIGTGGMTYAGGGFTLNCLGQSDTFVVNKPGSSPEGSWIQFSSPGGLPGISGNYGGNFRTDLQFAANGIFRIAVGSSAQPPASQFNFTSDGTFSASRIYAGYDSGTANAISCSGWFRSNGATGWTNNSYGGGIYMTDTTYLRSYANKAIMASDFVNSSDRRLKTGIRDLVYKGRLRPVEYTLTESGKDELGFIAQEVQELYPELVGVLQETGMLQLSYGRLTAILSSQLNGVEDEVTVMKTQLAAMQTALTSLQEELTRLKAASEAGSP